MSNSILHRSVNMTMKWSWSLLTIAIQSTASIPEYYNSKETQIVNISFTMKQCSYSGLLKNKYGLLKSRYCAQSARSLCDYLWWPQQTWKRLKCFKEAKLTDQNHPQHLAYIQFLQYYLIDTQSSKILWNYELL